MVSPFEDPEASFHVLVNAEGQHSLWPAFAPVPDGWAVIHGAASRPECVEFIERSWTDMRPRTMAAAFREG
jgi:MbtH protein